MTTHESIDHGWVREHIATYLAGGLPEEERARFEAHIGGCGPCLEDLQEAQTTERSLSKLFDADRPSPGMEDRVIQSLRSAPGPRFSIPRTAYRIASAIAAVVLIGLVGFYYDSETPTGSMTHFAKDASRGSSPVGWAQRPSFGRRSWVEEAPVGDGVTLVSPREAPRTADEMARSKSDELLARLKSGLSVVAGVDRDKEGRASDHNETALAFEESDRRAEYRAHKNPAGGEEFGGKKELERKGEWKTESFRQDLAPAETPALKDDVYFKPGGAAEDYKSLGVGGGSGGATKAAPRPGLLRGDAGPISNDAEKAKNQEPTGKTAPAQDPQAPQRKIIRQGEMEFEVDNFDSAVDKVARIVNEEKGFVATVNSDRLPNGKVKGTIVLRVPPEALDRLVLKLRALGDLKSQRITSEDISKKYYDLESRLKAARTMEARLIEIIKTGKGEIKDILAAEKELGEWREKIEVFEGELRYYGNLVSLSTLTLTLLEKDIRSPSVITVTETVDAGVEAEDVLKADKDLRAMITEAKGRITASDLKKLAADQFSLQITCEAPPENAGALRDRLNQLGRVARLDVQTQTSDDGKGRPVDAKVKRADTIFRLSVYNITNVQPRETSLLNIACIDVEAVFKNIIARVGLAGGRVVQSNLNRIKADQIDGLVQFEVPVKEGEAVLADLRALGEVMNLRVIENPDSANVTKSKKGFNVNLLAMAHVIARETTTIRFAAREVAEAYRRLQALVLEKKGRILDAQLNEQSKDNVTGSLDFELPRGDRTALDEALKAAGQVLSQTVQRAQDDGRVVDSKIRISLSLQTVASIGPRRIVKLGVEVSNVDRTAEQITALVTANGVGTLVDSQNSRDPSGREVSLLVYEAPLAASAGFVDAIRRAGTVRVEETKRNSGVPEGELATGRIELTLSNADPIVGGDDGFMAQLKKGLQGVIGAAGFSLKLILIGAFIVVPWALIVWLGAKLVRRFRSKPA